MSGFGECAACKRKGFTRKGSSHCTRCEKAAASGKSVPPVIVAEPAAPEKKARRGKKKRKLFVKAYGRLVPL